MEIPFDALLTLLIFLVGIPALILQLISPIERAAVQKKGRLDVRSFLRKALWIIGGGIVVQMVYAVFPRDEGQDFIRQVIQQLIWMAVFGLLFFLALDISQQIPEQYGRREKIVKRLTQDLLVELKKRKRLNVSGETFNDLVNLGKHCEAGQEREMVVNALMEVVKDVLADPKYAGDSLEMLIEELTHMLAFSPEAKDLYNYRAAVGILTTILAADHPAETEDDRRRVVHAISHLARTLIVNFKSVERDNVILAYVNSVDFASNRPNMLTEISQALFEIGVCAAKEADDFAAVAALDKLTTLAERQSPSLPIEFIADLFGLLGCFWAKEGSRRDYASLKFRAIKKIINKEVFLRLTNAREHLIQTMYFEEADNLGKMLSALMPATSPRVKH